MNSPFSASSRELYFIYGCVPIRSLIAISCVYLTGWGVHLHSLLTLIIGVTMIFLWTFKLRLNAAEGGGRTWWHDYRIIHGLLYLIASYTMFTGKKLIAFFILCLDVLIGIYAFMNK